MCIHTNRRDDPNYLLLRPRYSGGAMCQRDEKPPRAALLLLCAGSAEGVWHPTPDLLPLRSTLRPALRSLLFSSFRTGGERTTTLRLRGACGAALWLPWRLLGARVSCPGHRHRLFSQRYVRTLLTQRERRHAKTTEGPEERQLSFTPSLVRLTSGVDLLIGYVDLRYGCSFKELADLSQRTNRREVAPVRPI